MNNKNTMDRMKFKDFISDVIASSTTPQLSYEEFDQFFSSLISETLKFKGDGLSTEERAFVLKFAKVIFENLLDYAHFVSSQKELFNEDYYGRYSDWVTIVIGVISKRVIVSSNELLALVEMSDNITRRMFTKNRFIWYSKYAIVDATSLESTIQSLLKIISFNLTKEEWVEFEAHDQVLKVEVIAQLTEKIKKNKVLLNTWLEWEVERIYNKTIC